MSIKRVSDLPSIEEFNLERFKKSFMEVSYLSADQGSQVYASRKVKVQELLDGFRDIYYSKTPISGNVFVNCDLEGDSTGGTGDPRYVNYHANVYENRIDVTTVEGLHVDGGLQADSISTLQTGEWEDFGPRSVVPKSIINSQLTALKAYVDEQVAAAKAAAGVGGFPLLTFVYSDHKITSTSWAPAGTEVQLSQYPELCAALSFDDGHLTLDGESLPEADSTYYTGFRLAGGAQDPHAADAKLVLPTFASCFFELRKNVSEAGKYLDPGVPNLSGWFGQLPSSSSTNGDNKLFKRTTNDYKTGPNDGTKGNKDRRIIFNANRFNKIYRNDVTTVQPRSVTMAVYYYIGKKSGS